MSARFTGMDAVAVQVEAATTQVAVADAVATDRFRYPADGVYRYDLKTGLAYSHDTMGIVPATVAEHGILGWGLRPSPRGRQTTGALMAGSEVQTAQSVSAGPVLAQTKVAVPVAAGMTISMGGRLSLARGGQIQQRPSTGVDVAVLVEVVLWGYRTDVDGYGEATTTTVRLLTWETRLQATGSESTGTFSWTMPVQPWVTIPAGVEAVHLAVSVCTEGAKEYLAVQYASTRSDLRGATWTRSPFNVLSLPTTGDADCLRMMVRPPAGPAQTAPLASSPTGWAFPGRTTWSVTPGVAYEVTCCSAGGAQTVAISGGTVPTLAVPAGGHAAVTTTPTGTTLTLSSAATVQVVSVLPALRDGRHSETTRLARFDYTDVTAPVVQVQAESLEADVAVTTIRLVSDEATETLTAGRRVRVLALHPGGTHTVLVAGTIRRRKIVHDARHQAQVEISVHSAWTAIANTGQRAAFDQVKDYGHALASAGEVFDIDGVVYAGTPSATAGEFFPSYVDPDQSLADALLMTRNSLGGYLWVRADDTVVYRTALPDAPVLEVSDRPGHGDMSYSRELTFAGDSDSIVNILRVQEHMIDPESLELSLSGDDPPVLFPPVASQSRSIDYTRAPSVAVYGPARKTLDVVRGSGMWADIIAGNWGLDFAARAAAILDQTSTESTELAKLTLPVSSAADVANVARLEPMDAVLVRFRESSTILRIRRVEHDIRPGRWLTTVHFTPSRNQTLWQPPSPPIPEGIVDAGTAAIPALGWLDGGTPASTGTGIIDGQEQ